MKRKAGMTADQFKAIREQMHWTQADMAFWLGIDRNTVARMEKEMTIPVPLARLARLITEEKNRQKMLALP